MKKYKWLQECLVCDYKCEYESDNKEDENIIRAAVLECGHQGLFNLKLTKTDYKND